MESWRVIGLLVTMVGVLALVGYMIYDARVRLPERRKQWTDGRGDLCCCEEAYLSDAGVPAVGVRARVYLALRRAVADECGVPPDFVRPELPIKTLDGLTFDGFDAMDAIHELEDALGIEIPCHLAERLPTPNLFETVGAWSEGVYEGLVATGLAHGEHGGVVPLQVSTEG